jgi:hypothetical protein
MFAAFSLRQESPNWSGGDKPLISEVVLSRTWYNYSWSWLASWALDGLAYCRETFVGNTYELWQSNSDSQSRQFKGQYEVIKTHQKTVKVNQENEKLWCFYIGLYPYCQSNIVRQEVSGNSNCKSYIVWVSRTMSDGTGHCLLGGVWKCDFLPKFSPFFPSLILKL